MSVHDRLADAQLLFDNGHYDGALTMLLIAVAATSRKRFPDRHAVKDGEAFSRFVDAEAPVISGTATQITMSNGMNIQVEGRMLSLGQLLYRLLRNDLIHEANVGDHVRFTDDPKLFVASYRGVITFNLYFLQGLANAVLLAPENAGAIRTGGKTSLDGDIPDSAGRILAWMTSESIDLRRSTKYVPPVIP